MAIWAEQVISDIVAIHFCPDEDRYRMFFSVVMSDPDLKFSTKTQMFEQILRLCYKDILADHTDLVEELGKIRRHRNDSLTRTSTHLSRSCRKVTRIESNSSSTKMAKRSSK